MEHLQKKKQLFPDRMLCTYDVISAWYYNYLQYVTNKFGRMCEHFLANWSVYIYVLCGKAL